MLRTPADTVAQAHQLLDDGKPFHAHEVFEDAWKSAAEDRALWKALAQLAVGLTHAARGNERGRIALLERARTGLRGYAGRTPYGIDVDGLLRWLDAALAGGTTVLLRLASVDPSIDSDRSSHSADRSSPGSDF